MYQKAILFNDFEIAKQVLNETDVRKIKALGRKVKGFDNTLWDQHKENFMYNACYAKFSQNDRLKDFLLNTGNYPTIEDVKLIEFDQSKHRRYSNYMAVNVDNIKQIPDTNEIIGVPITFLDKYNPEQFEILGMSGDREFVDSDCDFFIPVTKEQENIFKEQNKDWRDTHPYFSDGDKLTKLLYVRLFIRKKGT